MLNFDQNLQFLRKSLKKNMFLPLFVQNGLKIDKNSKIDFELLFGLKTST